MYKIQGKTYTWEELQEFMYKKDIGFLISSDDSQVIFRDDLYTRNNK